jgi:hypothetical protein
MGSCSLNRFSNSGKIFDAEHLTIKNLGGNMKIKSIEKRLVLKKETVVRLDEEYLRKVKGGGLTVLNTLCFCYTEGTYCPTRDGAICTGQ